MNGIQWNGKGKKYQDHKIIFDGEYLNGKEWKGKSYNYLPDGNLIFKGKY